MLEPHRLSRAQRELRSLIATVGADDAEGFAALVALSEWLATDGLPAAAAQLTERGYSWAELARPLGVTRQAAWERFRRRNGRPASV